MDAENSFTHFVPNKGDIFCEINSLRGLTEDIVDSNKQLQAEKIQLETVASHLQLTAVDKFNVKTIEELSECVQNPINLPVSQQQHVFIVHEMFRNKVKSANSIRTQMNFSLKYSNHISSKIEQLMRYVLDVELYGWKRSQQMAGIGHRSEDNQLNILQQWFESLAELTWFNLTECKIMKDLMLCQYILKYIAESTMFLNKLNELMTKFTELLKLLVTNSLAIEKQPPQVMKTNTRFSTKLRLLVGRKLNLGDHALTVKVVIISENQASILMSENILKGENCGELSNNSGCMEFDQSTSQLSISFRNMQLKKIKRAEKKGSESVVDEKCALYFSTKLSVCGEFELLVGTISLPVAVIVHGNQEPHALATIIWDNAFSLPGRTPFAVPDKVPWHQAAHALNLKFASLTGKALSEDNMLYLAEKLFKVQRDNYSDMPFSWCQFCKEPLDGRTFTFWDWFHAIMKLTTYHLKSLWVDNTILGFIGKRKAQAILKTCPSGTFLLRFSDSELGGITVGWVGGTGDQKKVMMLQPFTAKDFAIRNLADRLSDLSHLVYLYPDIPKQAAFGSHYTPVCDLQNTAVNGYLKPVLVTQVPGWGNLTSNPMNQSGLSPTYNSYPNTPTPQSMTLRDSPPDPVPVMSEPNINYGGISEINYSELMDNSMDFADMDMNFSVL